MTGLLESRPVFFAQFKNKIEKFLLPVIKFQGSCVFVCTTSSHITKVLLIYII